MLFSSTSYIWSIAVALGKMYRMFVKVLFFFLSCHALSSDQQVPRPGFVLGGPVSYSHKQGERWQLLLHSLSRWISVTNKERGKFGWFSLLLSEKWQLLELPNLWVQDNTYKLLLNQHSMHIWGIRCVCVYLAFLISYSLDCLMLKEVANDNYRVASWCTV